MRFLRIRVFIIRGLKLKNVNFSLLNLPTLNLNKYISQLIKIYYEY